MITDLEFVCGGNNGRSPIAEAIAKDYCVKGDISGINIMSTGTRVDFLKNATPEQIARAILPYIPIVLDKGFITPEQAEQLRQGRGFQEILFPLLSRLTRLETERRDNILYHKGLSTQLVFNRTPVRTRARQEAELIFPIGQENYEIVSRMYAQAGLSPTIECLGDFPDTFFMDIWHHNKVADQIEQATVRVMEKYLI